MDYSGYIEDWQADLLEKEDYSDTQKIAFSYLNVARDLLSEYKLGFDHEPKQLEELTKIENLLKHAYLESGHLEIQFDDMYRLTLE